MRTRIVIAAAVIFLLTPVIFIKATNYSSSDFTVKDSVIAPGGGYSTSASYKLWSSLGQSAIGLSNSATFIGKSGFLYFPATATSSPPPPPPPPTPTPGGGAGPGPQNLTTSTIPRRPNGQLICDFDNDGKCNITDFSIMLYYYGEPVASASQQYDLNNDGQIDIVDVSILLYYWMD